MSRFTLNPIVLPQDGALRRDHIVPHRYRLAGYDDTYDFHTLAYDVVWMPRQRALLLVCPKLLNLEKLLKQGAMTADGVTLPRPRICRYRRHDEVWIPCPTQPAHITLRTKGLTLGAAVSCQESAFNGKNVLLTKSKDNALVWLTDWVRHHRVDQGADAVLVFDNGSNDYALADLQHAIGPEAGVQTAAAIASDFPFGSWKASKLIHRSMFYQAAMLNLARHRFVQSARAVLPSDVDEMVTGANVFDAAANSRLGYVTIPAVWRYSQLPDGQMPRHADHIWRRDPEATCKEKYALAPGRWFTRTTWDIHGLHRYAFNNRVKMRDAKLLHCEHISTSWKRHRNAEEGMTLRIDPDSEKALAAH